MATKKEKEFEIYETFFYEVRAIDKHSEGMEFYRGVKEALKEAKADLQKLKR